MKKKKKRSFTIVYIVVALIAAYVVLTLTGMARLFKIPTSSSQPTLEVGDQILVSNLVSPDRYDLIVFTYNDSTMGKNHHVFRLCGMPGDTVEIRNGDLFVNGKLPDKKFEVCQPYKISADDIQKVTALVQLQEDDVQFYSGPQVALVYLSDTNCETLKKNNVKFERMTVSQEQKNDYIVNKYGKPWNEDHFGPLVVPANHYFVLGDNRNRAMDSRYTGMVPFSDFTGTVIVQ